MKIKKDQVTLRDIQIEDIDDYVRWYTTDTEWMNWDAPWEGVEEINIDKIITNIRRRINQVTNNPRRRFEICLESGEHVGWVTSYFIDGDTTKIAVGINIPEDRYRGRGNGRRAIECWIEYLLLEHGLLKLYTQTWSGNLRMMELAKRLGFQEINRRIGTREVRGDYYDAITYEVTRERFFEGKFDEVQSFI